MPSFNFSTLKSLKMRKLFHNFQRSRAAIKQKKHKEKISKSHDLKENIFTNSNKIIQGQNRGANILVPGSISKGLVITIIALCWSIIKEIFLRCATDLDHTIAMIEVTVKSHSQFSVVLAGNKV